MTSPPVQRHDQFFQQLLDKPGTAGILLRERLPADVVAQLADTPPELVPGTFVSGRLRSYRTDRLYRMQALSGRPVFVYALLEHKSRPHPRTGLQLLGYQSQILDRWDRVEGRNPDGSLCPLPAIITMVVYHGHAAWNIPLSLAEMTDADPALRPHILDFRYCLVDLGRIPDAQLSEERRLRIGLLILKHGTLRGANQKKLLQIARQAFRLGSEDLATFLYYLLGDSVDDPRGELAREILRELVPEQEESMMSLIAEQWKNEGFNLGLQQGVARGKTEGKAEGKAEGKKETLRRQLRLRFTTVPSRVDERIQSASIEQLDEWADRILDAKTLEDIFGPDLAH